MNSSYGSVFLVIRHFGSICHAFTALTLFLLLEVKHSKVMDVQEKEMKAKK